MSLEAMILLLLKSAIVLAVFALGLGTTPQDTTYLFHRPRRLVMALLSMNVIMPLFAAAMIAAFELRPAVEIVLIALAVSPIPPMLPQKSLKAGGAMSYTISLLLTASLLAIVFVPLAMELLGLVFGKSVQVSPWLVAKIVALTVLAPLMGGLLVSHLARAFAQRIAKPISVVSTVLLIAGAIPILFTVMPTIVSLIGNGTLAAIVAFVLLGLLVGHLLGGPEPAQRRVLALTTSSKHPGVAAAIAIANFPEKDLVLAAILLYLLVNIAISIPYIAWCNRHRPNLDVLTGAK